MPAARKSRTTAETILVGIDTGGTFTDFVSFEDGGLRVHKQLSTPGNPAKAVLAGLQELFGPPAGDRRPVRGRVPRHARITYASTVATNAVLERKGARVLLLTTAGFEDVLEIGRQTRPDLYGLEPAKVEPLVPRRRRIGVDQRTAFDGTALVALSPAAVQAAVAAARRLGAQSVAICLLHSYAHAADEKALGRALRSVGFPCSLSHEIVAEYREYERTSTTVMNAYVAPVMERHLRELRRGVGRTGLRVMQSNGGAISVQTASREAVRTLLSGPAAGVIGAIAAGRRIGEKRLITFDMGGTSTDVCLIDGKVRLATDWALADLPVKVPAIDIHTVGAGGGSIAHLDAGDALKVGPESAGADPGPACYGTGNAPTVTDADLVLGRLIPDAFLGGGMTLDAQRAGRVLEELGVSLGMPAERAAEGVVRVVNAGMERAIRRISVERGHDPRSYTLVAFGGAAGMHAVELATSLGIRRVLLPVHPGLLSAWGAVSADFQRDYVQTVRLVDPGIQDLERCRLPLERRARRDLRIEAGEGRVEIAGFLDLRYQGQSYEIRLPMAGGYRRAFHTAHGRLYGYADRHRPIEVVNVRVTGTIRGASPRSRQVGSRSSPAEKHRLRWNGRSIAAGVRKRDGLPLGRAVAGPLIITEFSATTFVPPAWTACRTRGDDLILEGGKG